MKKGPMPYGQMDYSEHYKAMYELGSSYAYGNDHGIYDASKPTENTTNNKKAFMNSEDSVKY